MSDLYDEVKALLGDECHCGGTFLECDTSIDGCCEGSVKCGGDTMRKLYLKIKGSDHKPTEGGPWLLPPTHLPYRR